MKGVFILFMLSAILLVGNKSQAQQSNGDVKIKYAGVRSSNYGIKPFPTKDGWVKAMNKMSDNFYGSTASAIWIVGVMKDSTTMYLEFPSEGKELENVVFAENDKHEPYLDHFDKNGIKVFLQVESANANVSDVIDVVLSRYKHHPSVIGFGVDVEWYQVANNPGWGAKATDANAKIWEQKIKQHNKDYRLFLKHWDPKWMPETYRGEIIFVNDSQIFESFEPMITEYKSWADKFSPNPVFFQIGYPSDEKWWSKYENPPKYLGEKLTENIEGQECGIFWVDFTLKQVLPVN